MGNSNPENDECSQSLLMKYIDEKLQIAVQKAISEAVNRPVNEIKEMHAETMHLLKMTLHT